MSNPFASQEFHGFLRHTIDHPGEEPFAAADWLRERGVAECKVIDRRRTKERP